MLLCTLEACREHKKEGKEKFKDGGWRIILDFYFITFHFLFQTYYYFRFTFLSGHVLQFFFNNFS